jgi:hypothetical protein
MEHHAQSLDDALISGLSYKLKPGASYVTNRRSVTYFAQGGNQYSTSGVKVMKFNLTGDQWLDPSSFQVMFQLNNRSATKPLRSCYWNPAVLFSRMRIIAGGVVIEDISDANKLSVILDYVSSEEDQRIRRVEGFGREEGSTLDSGDSIKANKGRIMLFKPIFGLLKQEKLIPLRYCPLQIELELISTPSDVFVIDGTYDANFDITDIQVKCDLLTLDNSLDNEYASHLLSGKTLPINFSTWNHTNQSTGNDPNFSAHITRALTRLKSVFITLQDQAGGAELSFYKIVNTFWHPMGSRPDADYDIGEEHQVQIQVGSKLFPEYPIKGLAEAMYQLKKTVGKPFNITDSEYRLNKYIVALDMEKISHAGFTGLNTKAGEMLTINFRNCTGFSALSTPSRVFCALHYDAVINIKSEGIELLD